MNVTETGGQTTNLQAEELFNERVRFFTEFLEDEVIYVVLKMDVSELSWILGLQSRLQAKDYAKSSIGHNEIDCEH